MPRSLGMRQTVTPDTSVEDSSAYGSTAAITSRVRKAHGSRAPWAIAFWPYDAAANTVYNGRKDAVSLSHRTACPPLSQRGNHL
jgi:hypothetical protein